MSLAQIVLTAPLLNECFAVAVVSEPGMAERRSWTLDGFIDG